MNSKQRKQKEKRLAEALASEGVTSGLKKLERERAEFERKLSQEKEALAIVRKKIEDDRAELTQQVAVHNHAMKDERHSFQKRADQYSNKSILNDVLVALECDLDPIDIAAKLRKDFDLLIPQW